tara:strand:+ start:555 stop:1325 length:771 start_codon:yes stop_codon:yes gene_type:complete
MTLSGQTILITGAAGRIGGAIAKKVSELKANLILCDINEDRLNTIASELLLHSESKVLAIKADITNNVGISLLLKKCRDNFSTINAAVHCAYPTSPKWGTKFEELEGSFLNKDLTMQLGGAILFSQKIIEVFNNQGGGNLIHVSSIQGIQAPKFEHYEGTNMTSPIEYAAIKSGIIAITSWLAKYCKNKSIRVNCISPGGISDSQPSSFVKKYRNSCTNFGLLSSDQVASCAIFLLSKDSEAINGQNIIVDDGWTL